MKGYEIWLKGKRPGYESYFKKTKEEVIALIEGLLASLSEDETIEIRRKEKK